MLTTLNLYGIALEFKKTIGINTGKKEVYEFFTSHKIDEQIVRSRILDLAKQSEKKLKQLIRNTEIGELR